MRLGFSKKEEPVDTQIEDNRVQQQVEQQVDRQLSGSYPYLEKQHRTIRARLEKSMSELHDIQQRVEGIQREQEIFEFIMENKNLKVTAAWILERIQQIKDNTSPYNIINLEDELISEIKKGK